MPEKKLVSPPIAQPDSSTEKLTEVSGQYSPAIHLQIPLSSSDAPLISNNHFVMLGDTDLLYPDCNSIPIPLNPLTDKLKLIDEKECRDLKSKAIVAAIGSPSTKRRNKGRGRKSTS